MPEPSKPNLAETQLADGTIDFYTMIGEAPDASTDDLRATIQRLYAEAQANRDHRNLTKRKEYQALLELIPDARNVLLDESRRASYDEYLAHAKAGTASPDFETFMTDLMGLNEPMEEKTGLLGVKEGGEAGPRVIKAPKETRERPAKSQAPAKKPTRASSDPTPPLATIGGGVAGLILGYIVGNLMFHSLVPALLVGIIVGAVVFVLLNRKPGGKIGV